MSTDSESARIPRLPDSATGLPALRSWRWVYVFVLAALALWIGLLTLLPHLFA